MKFIAGLIGGSAAVVLVICLLLLSPMLLLWAINTISEQSGSSFYVQHNFWSYLACFVLMALLRGGKD